MCSDTYPVVYLDRPRPDGASPGQVLVPWCTRNASGLRCGRRCAGCEQRIPACRWVRLHVWEVVSAVLLLHTNEQGRDAPVLGG
jgi:hypothetical protein